MAQVSKQLKCPKVLKESAKRDLVSLGRESPKSLPHRANPCFALGETGQKGQNSALRHARHCFDTLTPEARKHLHKPFFFGTRSSYGFNCRASRGSLRQVQLRGLGWTSCIAIPAAIYRSAESFWPGKMPQRVLFE